jgi:hypothetical protein
MPAVFMWVRGGAVGWGTAIQAGRLWIRFPIRSLEFLIDINLSATLRPSGWLSLWGKDGRCEGLTTLPPSWNLETLTSWNPQGLYRPVEGQLYFLLYLLAVWLKNGHSDDRGWRLCVSAASLKAASHGISLTLINNNTNTAHFPNH